MRRCVPIVMALCFGACRPKPVNPQAPAADARVAVRPPPTAEQLPLTLDRWRPWATFYQGANNEAAVVLVHQLGSNRGEWSGLVQRLQAGRAVSTLAIDLRGHGDSVRNVRDDRVTWEQFGTDPARWAGTALDVVAAVQFLRAYGARRVVVVGSSLGGSAALLAATGTLGAYAEPPNAAVDAVAILSPGVAYRGLDLREPARRYLASGRPLLLFAGDQDAPSAEAVSVLAPGNLPNVEAEVFGAAREHGVSLCNAAPARWDRLDTWIRRALGILPPAMPATSAASSDAAASGDASVDARGGDS